MSELGIDLGTWSVAAAVVDERGRRVVPDPVSGQSWFRSGVALAPDGSWLVGRGAEEFRTTHPERYRDDLKRLLASGAPVYLDGSPHDVGELLAVLIGRVLRLAGDLVDEPITVLRLGVPVTFEGGRRDSLLRAAKLAGFDGEIELVQEPLAAAQAALGAEATPGTWLVVDLGGGTLDLALVSIGEGVVLIDVAGSDELGGFALDDEIVEYLKLMCGLPRSTDVGAADHSDLVAAARSLKHQLSDATVGYARNPLRTGPRTIELRIDELHAVSATLVDGVLAHAHRLLTVNDVGRDGLAGVLLTGGATRSPAIAERLSELGLVRVVAEPPELLTVIGLVTERVAEPPPDTSTWRVEVTASDRRLLGLGYEPVTAENADELEPSMAADGQGRSVHSVAFSREGHLLATASSDHLVRFWNLRLERSLVELHGHAAAVSAVAFAPTGDLVASGSLDRTVRVWRPLGQTPPLIMDGPEVWAQAVAVSPFGLVAAGGNDEILRLWESATGKTVRSIPVCGCILSIKFVEDDDIIVSTTDELVRWSIDGRLRWSVKQDGVAAVSPDGRTVAVGSENGDITLRHVADGGFIDGLSRRKNASSLAFSPRGNLLAVATDDGPNVGVYDSRSLERLAKLHHGTAGVNAVTFSPDGCMLVTGTDEGTTVFWTVR